MKVAIKPAARLNQVSEYYFSRKLKEIARRRAAGEDIISLAVGSPDRPPSPLAVDVLCHEARKADAHGYQPTAGIPQLREAMADWYKRWYDVNLDPHTEIQPLIGSKEGILHVTLAFCNPSDKVLIPDPGYPTYSALSRMLGQEVVHYNLKEENCWQPDFDELEKIVEAGGVKILWTNYPHMPTGAPASMETYHRIVTFARRHTLLVVNDNPYSFILNDQPLSILQIPEAKECCIEFNSMSKSHNMPGWRIGMMAGNAQFISWVLKVKSNIDNGTFRPMQLAAAEAYRAGRQWHREANVEIYKGRRAIAEEIMTKLGCTFDKKQVGMFLWGRIPSHFATAEELTERVLNEAHVFITPGFIFGHNGEQYIRISLCAPRKKMEEALERIIQSHIQ